MTSCQSPILTVDKTRCHHCGECVRDCLARIIALDDDGFPEIDAADEPECMRCQHCMAVCPEGAVSILGRSPEASISLDPGRFPSLDAMDLLVRGRRSVRHYEARNVDPALLSRLLATLANVPTGANACLTTFTVIDDIDVMASVKAAMIKAIRRAAVAGNLPARYGNLTEQSDERMAARIFRNAPHALIASVPPTAPCPSEDAALAIATFDLLAQCAGLGCVWWGMLRYFANTIPEIKEILGLPADHLYSAALFGYPAIEFARTVQRDDAAVVRRVGAGE